MAALGISLGAKSTKRDMVLCRKCWQQGWTRFSFYMLKVKGGAGGDTENSHCFASLGLQLTPLYSNYATSRLCFKIKIRFGGMFRIFCSVKDTHTG